MIETIFDTELIALLKSIAKVANTCGYKVFLIGGLVRDLLLGKRAKDIDIVVEGDAVSLSAILKESLPCKIIKTQPELKTVRIEFADGVQIDFASTRCETYGEKKGIPILKKICCSLEEDVLRRDFSVNALAISLNRQNFGEVIDFVNGQEDLKNKTLRILHDNSFNDDPTRIIRAFKFAHRLGFRLDEKTQKLQDEYLNNKNYDEIVSLMRIKKEMYEVFNFNSVEVMQDFIEKKIYKVLTDKINQVDFKKINEIIKTHNIRENIAFIYFMNLFLLQENYPILKNFNLTKQEIKIINDLRFAGELDGKLSELEIYQQYSIRSKESLVLEFLLKNNSNIQKYFDKLQNIKIEISGEDLLMMGVPESKSFSLIFDKVLEEKINGNLPDKSSELRFVSKLLLDNKV